MCERTLHPPHLSIDSIALSKASFHFYATLANYLIGYFQLYAGRKSFSLWDDTLLLLAGSCTENQLNAGVLRVGGWFITAPQRDNYSGYLWICRETKETASVLCTLSVPHVYIDLVQKDLRIFAQIPSPAPWVVVRIYKGRAVADVMWLAGWLLVLSVCSSMGCYLYWNGVAVLAHAAAEATTGGIVIYIYSIRQQIPFNSRVIRIYVRFARQPSLVWYPPSTHPSI